MSMLTVDVESRYGMREANLAVIDSQRAVETRVSGRNCPITVKQFMNRTKTYPTVQRQKS